MSWLADYAGLSDALEHVDELPVDVVASLTEALAGHARTMLIGGYRHSRDDWMALTPVERSAFVCAGTSLKVEQACRIGRAARGDLEEAWVVGEVDGYESYADMHLASSVLGAAIERSLS